ncbi:MAG TPA: SBBP repeat-containing protein [Kofleriaceae bacterium]|nr:SBBP repeat-containing protein [Kofleriaceae bacterium]
MSGLTVLLFGVAVMAGGCGDNVSIHSPDGTGAPPSGPPPGQPGDPGNPMGPGSPGDPGPGPSACDAAWHDFQHGTELDDQLWGMTIDDHNNVYIVGYEHGLGHVTNIEPDGDSHGMIVKLDPTGAVQWSSSIDSDATDAIEDITIEPRTGRIFAVGRTSGSFPGFTNQGQFDELLLALDGNGQVQQLVEQGDELPQHPARLGMGVDHDLVVAGYNDTFVNNNAVEGLEDGFVQRLSVQDSGPGNSGQAPGQGGGAGIEFSQSFLQTGPVNVVNRVTSVAVETDGSRAMYVTGFITAGRNVGIYVKKIAADGTQLWNTPITRISIDNVTGVALSPAGLLFVTGATFATLGERSFGQQDAFVMNIDKDTGEIVWAAQAGSTESDEPVGLGFDADNNIYIAGITTGSVVDGAPSHGGIDVFAMKFGPRGNLLASWQAGTEADDLATTMAVDHCGHVLIGGYSPGAMVSDGPAPAGGDDMFVVRASFP